MKNKIVFAIMLTALTCALVNAQNLSKHRGTQPTIESDGTVMDNSKALGWIQNGKIYDVSGKTLGTISDQGTVTASNGKTVGAIQKNDGFVSSKGQWVLTDDQGTVKVGEKVIGKVDPAYRKRSHGALLFCFFSVENEESFEIDNPNN